MSLLIKAFKDFDNDLVRFIDNDIEAVLILRISRLAHYGLGLLTDLEVFLRKLLRI